MIEDITPTISASAKVLESYGPGRFTVSGEMVYGSIIISAGSLVNWDVQNFSDISIESFSPLFELEEDIDVVIIGCGEKTQLISAEIRNHFKQAGITLDFMTTGSASRTYNVMLSEGRQVAAALIVLDDDV